MAGGTLTFVRLNPASASWSLRTHGRPSRTFPESQLRHSHTHTATLMGRSNIPLGLLATRWLSKLVPAGAAIQCGFLASRFEARTTWACFDSERRVGLG